MDHVWMEHRLCMDNIMAYAWIMDGICVQLYWLWMKHAWIAQGLRAASAVYDYSYDVRMSNPMCPWPWTEMG